MMKKMILILALLVFISGCTQQIVKTPKMGEEQTGVVPQQEIVTAPGSAPLEEEAEIFCSDYDGNQQECLSHTGCEWSAEENNCDPVGGTGEKEDEKAGEEDEGNEFASELEKDLPDTVQNRICRQLPLAKGLSPGDKYACLAVVNNNPGFCEMIEADNEEDMDALNEKNVCLAHAKKDVSYCKKVTSALGKRTCYFGLSLISGNINICDGIDYDRDLKQLCYFSFVNTLYWEGKSDKITLAHCNKLPEPDRSTCLAYKEGDVSLCKNNVNCLTYFEQPMSFCTTGKGSVLESCIRDRAMTSKDISICEQLSGEKRDDCISDLAGHITQDVSTCDKITGDFARNTCYKDVAVQSSTVWLSGLRDN